MVEVVLRTVSVDVASATPILLLEEVHGKRILPIFIGQPEAAAIAYALQEVETPRPMTHDLMGEIITSLGGKVFNVEIQNLVGSTYYAALRILLNGAEVTISARPSDAVALALRVGAPILVNDELMDAEAQIFEADDEEDDEFLEGDGEVAEEELVAELHEFLDGFGKSEGSL
jgi:bifunctional DNase/RNase